MASGVATVKEVISGDTLVLVGIPPKPRKAILNGGPPPEKRVSLCSVVAPRVAVKTLTHESSDEPFGFAAREFLRQQLIGQQVQFKVEFAAAGKEYACVLLQGQNVACELLRRGLARLRDNKNPPVAHDIHGSPAAAAAAAAAGAAAACVCCCS
ncbi:2e999-prov protein, related [Eimeria tenella]|uniref:2e999-prov protein, related n=1 Tax=Eimeria tenella TaxID=5802 RepID=U6KKL9_EIMTE|nr:2e999-prov protein, related [Eimeria tenella]CDJ38464.1 2e999-prov protein, related [Eimeria tenella]|eukprot:XP_013229302.1 2e999-prov protein, related [Eimeria tenella]